MKWICTHANGRTTTVEARSSGSARAKAQDKRIDEFGRDKVLTKENWPKQTVFSGWIIVKCEAQK